MSSPLPQRLNLSGWTSSTVTSLRKHGFDLIQSGIKVPADDPLQTSAYFIPLLDPPISLVLGIRKRKEDEEDLEAFFEVCDGQHGNAGKVTVRITHFMEGAEKWWRYDATHPNIGIAEQTGTETSIAYKVEEWINHIITTIKVRTTAAMLSTTARSP